jgi:hypothetical protein
MCVTSEMNALSLQMYEEGTFHPDAVFHDVCASCIPENCGMFDAI